MHNTHAGSLAIDQKPKLGAAENRRGILTTILLLADVLLIQAVASSRLVFGKRSSSRDLEQ